MCFCDCERVINLTFLLSDELKVESGDDVYSLNKDFWNLGNSLLSQHHMLATIRFGALKPLENLLNDLDVNGYIKTESNDFSLVAENSLFLTCAYEQLLKLKVSDAVIANFVQMCRDLLVITSNIFPEPDAIFTNSNEESADQWKDPVHEFIYYGSYCPKYPIRRKLNHYKVDKEKKSEENSGQCWKHYFSAKKNGRMLMIFSCLDCGCILGFSVLPSSESPKNLFEFIFTRFDVPPSLVMYDNACNASVYCLLREPEFFKNTRYCAI